MAGVSPDFDLKGGSSMDLRILAARVAQVAANLKVLQRKKGKRFLISLPSSLFVKT
jgi:hypothetical protein